MAQPFAFALINKLLPPEFKMDTSQPLNKKVLKKTLVKFALKYPEKFNEVLPQIKQYGDMFATNAGISVGLDDIEPNYKERNAILDAAEAALKRTTDPDKRSDIFLDAQAKVRKVTAKHKGDLGLMARSGGRGNINQLMKTVSSPVVVGDFDGNPVDQLIKRSYAEGLSPMEYWVAADESRGQVIKGQLGTSEPGDMSKILANTTNRQVVTDDDCGTKNGLRMSIDDPQVIGRFLARDQPAGKRNTEVTQAIVDAKAAKFLFVRAPMTCEATEGVCSHCQGIMANGKRMAMGEHAGLRAAQACSEPLTQMALSSKHGVALVEGAVNIPRGLSGVRQFLEAPKSFAYKAILAKKEGKITSINKAPQGGNYINIDQEQHYVAPNMKMHVKVGDRVEAGDAMTEGFANPTELVEFKGLGEGRKYVVENLQRLYKDSGVDIDTRNLEHIVKPHMNYVMVEDAPDGSDFIPGEIVKQNMVDKALRNSRHVTKVPVDRAEGHMIAENYMHHVAGTKVTKSMVRQLAGAGITQVAVLGADSGFSFKPHMTSITRSPLLNDNWLNKLGHRYLKQTVLEGAHYGQSAETSGYAPLAAYTRGRKFKSGPKGKY